MELEFLDSTEDVQRFAGMIRELQCASVQFQVTRRGHKYIIILAS